ncbi:MAG: HD domain-containing protein [bacterium]
MEIDIKDVLHNLGRIYPRLLATKERRRLFLVGGAIRDLLLGKKPADFDFAVSGSGLDFAREFARAVRGKLVILSEENDEARVVYRKKITLDFNGIGDLTIIDDLKRRDFTLNALACELPATNTLIDPFGGRKDINQKLIRPVSAESLVFDPLRLLRAFRLALELDFTVDPAVYEQTKAITLKNTAAERIGTELLRILQAPNSLPYLKKLADLQRWEEIVPELLPLLNDKELWAHTIRTVEKIEELISQPGFFSRFAAEWQNYFSYPNRPALLKLAALFHDIAKPHTRFINESGETHFYGHDSLGAKLTGKVCHERLRLSRTQTKIVQTIVKEHMRLHLLATAPELSDRAIRRFFRDLQEEAFGLMLLCYADGWATAGRTAHLETAFNRMIMQKRAEDARIKVRRLVTGDDLIALGMKPGPAFKVILQELEDLQIEGKIKTKEDGLEYLKTSLARTAER